MTDKSKTILAALAAAVPKLDALPNEPTAKLVAMIFQGDPLLEIKLADLLEITIGDLVELLKVIESLKG